MFNQKQKRVHWSIMTHVNSELIRKPIYTLIFTLKKVEVIKAVCDLEQIANSNLNDYNWFGYFFFALLQIIGWYIGFRWGWGYKTKESRIAHQVSQQVIVRIELKIKPNKQEDIRWLLSLQCISSAVTLEYFKVNLFLSVASIMECLLAQFFILESPIS